MSFNAVTRHRFTDAKETHVEEMNGAYQIIVVHGRVFLFPQQEMYLSEAAAGSVNEKAARRLTQRDAALPLW